MGANAWGACRLGPWRALRHGCMAATPTSQASAAAAPLLLLLPACWPVDPMHSSCTHTYAAPLPSFYWDARTCAAGSRCSGPYGTSCPPSQQQLSADQLATNMVGAGSTPRRTFDQSTGEAALRPLVEHPAEWPFGLAPFPLTSVGPAAGAGAGAGSASQDVRLRA